MKARCDNTEDQGSEVFKCHLFTEERRLEIFQSVRVGSDGKQPR